MGRHQEGESLAGTLAKLATTFIIPARLAEEKQVVVWSWEGAITRGTGLCGVDVLHVWAGVVLWDSGRLAQWQCTEARPAV